MGREYSVVDGDGKKVVSKKFFAGQAWWKKGVNAAQFHLLLTHSVPRFVPDESPVLQPEASLALVVHVVNQGWWW